MIPEIGHFALSMALALAILGAGLPMWGAYRRDARLAALASPLMLGQLLFAVIAFAALMYAYIQSDFSVLAVARNSHTAKPLLYKISGVWGNHEGSLLLWALVLTIFGSAVAAGGRGLPQFFRARVLSVQSMISVGFFLFMLLTSNPFDRVVPVPFEGNGLNPLLQDPGLAFHPPILYLGYVGLSVAFSFAIAALIEGEVTPAWGRWVRPWTLAAWSFLTGGIVLGAWWAYYELGWGGWWFWDPVENASFMPWLAATALLHSAIVVEKRDAMKTWTILLAILAFSLSLLGTFLVRSGVLTSVHAFAVDPARGVFILGFLGVVIGGSLLLYAMRAHRLQAGGLFKLVSREGGLVLNNILLVVALATVFFGTLYPLLLDAVTGEKLSVGAPFYEATFVPLMVPLILVMAVGPLLPWKKASASAALGRLKVAGGLTVLLVIIIAWQVSQGLVLALGGITLGGWLAFSVLSDIAMKLKIGTAPVATSWARARGLGRDQLGMWLAHFGMAVMIFGITASEAWSEEKLLVLRVGDSVDVGGYSFVFEGAGALAGPNYSALKGAFTVSKNGRFVAYLEPEERSYSDPPMQTTEAAIHSMISGDLYAVVGDPTGDGGWSARLYFKPLIPWMWAGSMMMVLGGGLSLSDRRLRVGVARRKRPAAATGAAASTSAAAAPVASETS